MNINYRADEIDRIAAELLKSFDSRIILFYGEMGTGKTTLIRSLVKALGSNDDVSSPTFSLVNEYETNNGATIYHFDLYRAKDEEEILNFGFEDYFRDDAWIFIEWPEIAIQTIPNEYNIIRLEPLEQHSRSLKLSLKRDINL